MAEDTEIAATQTIIEIHDENAICTPGGCIPDEDQYKLECSECKRQVHYRCTKLPAYQIHLFLVKGYRKFVCTNCIEVPKYLAELLTSCDMSVSSQDDERANLHENITKISTEREVLRESNIKLTKKVTALQSELDKK